MHRRLPFLLISLLLWLPAGQAEIFKWHDDEGNLHFGDRPPQKARTEQVEVEINTFASPEILDAPEQAPDRPASAGDVVMYSAEWCGVCTRARNYFRSNDIPFSEYDVEKSSRGKREYQRLGGSGVPIIFVGKRRLNGFRPATFDSIYYH